MSKLTNNQRLEIYYKRKQGVTVSDLSKLYNVNQQGIKYLIRLLDKHGEEILRQDKNRYYSPDLKKKIINKILIEHFSVTETAIEYGLPINVNNKTTKNVAENFTNFDYLVCSSLLCGKMSFVR